MISSQSKILAKGVKVKRRRYTKKRKLIKQLMRSQIVKPWLWMK